MADKFVSQSNLSYFWSQVKTKLAGKVDTTDSRLTDSRTPTSHTHGNISNSGAVTATAAIASGDRLLIADSTNSVYGVVGSTITFGSFSTYLKNDGTWGTPTDTHLTQTVSTANSEFPVLLSSTKTAGTRTGIFGTGVTINPSTNTVTASIFSGALSGNATTATTAAVCSGNSATATKLATARTFTLSGNTTGSVSFDGSGDVTITTTTSSIGSATVGSASTPIYLNAGVPTACTIASGGLSTADRVSGTVVTVASLPTT